ncbi:MAG: sirohydrochlorin cobaltochelatase [Desulfobacteraceae bacterium]|jgi:sirohydrochlorin cobaltochelatase
MTIPIVIAAFGTTSRAMQTYDHMDAVFKQRFAGHEIHWAYTSRMVKDRLKQRQKIARRHPHQVLEVLARQGHPWAMVQSLHLTSAHEFYRLLAEVDRCGIRTSIGLPLLSAVEDYEAVVRALAPLVEKNEDEALVLVGHGTDHPCWSSYPALQHMLQQKYGAKVHVGAVEDGYPDQQSIVRAVVDGGYARVRLASFMLVAGVHFEEDLAGDEDSWKRVFEAAGIQVELEKGGVGFNPQIIEIFCRHMEAALDIIPQNINMS